MAAHISAAEFAKEVRCSVYMFGYVAGLIFDIDMRVLIFRLPLDGENWLPSLRMRYVTVCICLVIELGLIFNVDAQLK